MLEGSGWTLILFSEFSIAALSSQSANCPSLRADLWPNEMKSQLARNGFFQMWIQRCLRSLLSYHLCEDMLLTLLRFPLCVLYPGECSMPAAARWVAWHWEILNCIQDRLFALYTHKDGEKISKSFLLICCYWLLWSIFVSAASK